MHNFKAVYSLSENKKFEHHPGAMGYVCDNIRISAICHHLHHHLVSAVARGEECALFRVFFHKSKCAHHPRTRHHLLRPSQS